MKKRRLFAISLIGLALAACSTDDELNAGGNQSNNEGAVVTLKLNMSNTPLTKGSPGATNQQAGTDEENTISNVTVVVDYGTTQNVFKTSDEGVTWDGDKKTFKFQTPAGEATFYVYANVNDADNLSSNWLSNLVSQADDVSAYYTDNSFFMSNQNGVGIQHTINENTANDVTVSIERAAAKVTVESPAEFESTYGGTLSAMSFALGNVVDKFYLLQQSPIAVPAEVSYRNTTASETQWKAVTLGETVGPIALTAFNAQYCMENVQTSYFWSNTTYAKFQTTFTPAQALDFETSSSSSWTVKSGLKEVTSPISADDAPSFFVVLAGDAQYTSNYILKSDLYQEDGETPKDGLTITPATDGYTINGITGITGISSEYEGGKCYFGPVWINLNDAGDESPIYRNDWYHLKVSGINLPGSPSEPGGNLPDIPLTNDVNITVTLDVLDWEFEERVIVLQ